jgi:uncharacterized membrane protein YvbJ
MAFCLLFGTPLNDGVKFCDKCGTPVTAAAAIQPDPAPPVCAQCGTQLNEGEKFCSNCGKPLEGNSGNGISGHAPQNNVPQRLVNDTVLVKFMIQSIHFSLTDAYGKSLDVNKAFQVSGVSVFF